MEEKKEKSEKKAKNLWLVFLIPALVLAAAIWMTQAQSGRGASQADLTLKNFDVEGTAKTAFGTEIPKADVASLSFRGTLENAPEDAVDVSESGSGRVLLWAEDAEDGEKNLVIAGDGTVLAPADSSFLFGGKEYYRNLTAFDFGGVLDTRNVTNMHGMFYGCSALTDLDLSGFHTENTEAMDWMFSGCGKLSNLNLSGFHTEKVADFGWMFQNCHALEVLDLTGFVLAENANTFLMFQNCGAELQADQAVLDRIAADN